MRTGLALVVVILVGLVAASFVGIPTAARANEVPGVTPAATCALSPGLGVNPTDSGGFALTSFDVGLGRGAVYVQACDTTDAQGTVAVNDLNATRDGLTNPVASWTVNFVAGQNSSANIGKYYLIPLTLKLGGEWNVTLSATAGFTATNFTVVTYGVSLQATPSVVLPGQPAQLFYSLNWLVNQAPDTTVSTLTVTASYQTETTHALAVLPGFPQTLNSPMPLYNVSYTVPTTAWTRGIIIFAVFANTSAGTYPNSAGAGTDAYVGVVGIPTATLSSCVGCGATTFFATGSPVYLSISAALESPFATAPAADVPAELQFFVNKVPVSDSQISGSPPPVVSLSSDGRAMVFFWATTPPFNASGLANNVTVVLSDPWDASANMSSASVLFETGVVAQTPMLTVAFQYAHYYSGEEVTAFWQFGSYGAGVKTGWTVSQWLAATNTTIIAGGEINSNASGAQFSFKLPAGLTGTIEAEVLAYNATDSIVSSTLATALVTPVVLLLTPSELQYLPGDRVSVGVTVEGPAVAGLTLVETVADVHGNLLSNSSVAPNSSFQFTIPSVGTPTEVEITVAASNATAGILTLAQLFLDAASQFQFTASIATASLYSDNSYQPGQTIQVSYSLQAVGSQQLPTQFEIEVIGFGSLLPPSQAVLIQSSSSSGKVSVTIPGNTPDGLQTMEVEAVSGPLGSGYAAILALNVEKNPSVMNYEIGSGSGFTVGWLILLLLIVVVAVVMVLLIRRRPGGPKPVEPMQPFVPPEPSTTAGTGSSTSWQEGGAGPSPSAPPLPPPVQGNE